MRGEPEKSAGWLIADQMWLDTFEKAKLAKVIDEAVMRERRRCADLVKDFTKFDPNCNTNIFEASKVIWRGYE